MAIRGVGEDLSPGALALGRLLVGTAVLGAAHGRPRLGAARPAGSGRCCVVCGVGWFGIYNVALNAAEQHLDAGTTAMLVNIGPILIAVFAGLLLGEGFPRWLVAGIAVAFAGRGPHRRGHPQRRDRPGRASCSASSPPSPTPLGVVAQKPLLRRLPALQVTFTACAIGARLLPAVGRRAGRRARPRRRPGSIAGMVYLGVVPTALAFSTWAYALTPHGRREARRHHLPRAAAGHRARLAAPGRGAARAGRRRRRGVPGRGGAVPPRHAAPAAGAGAGGGRGPPSVPEPSDGAGSHVVPWGRQAHPRTRATSQEVRRGAAGLGAGGGGGHAGAVDPQHAAVAVHRRGRTGSTSSSTAERALPVLDPTGRQQVISCGIAVEFAVVALAGRRVRRPRSTCSPTTPTPTTSRPCEVTGTARARPARTARWPRRSTGGTPCARRSSRGRCPPTWSTGCRRRPAAFGTWVKPITRSEEEVATVFLISRAEEMEQGDPAYLAELQRWMRTDPAAVDGVPVEAVPSGDPHARPSNWLIRDFVVGSREQHAASCRPATPTRRRRRWSARPWS